MALMLQWADHRIEVRERKIRWFINDVLMAEGESETAMHGYFGMRHRYDRNTRIDDFQILKQEP
jgi:hypothetical protein